MSHIVPEQRELRAAVDAISDDRDRVFIELSYLGAFRASELTTKCGKWQLERKQTKPYGKELSWKLDSWQQHKCLVIKSAVAKRKVKAKRDSEPFVFKQIALPVDPVFEPWTKDLLKWLVQKKPLAFPICTGTANNIAKRWLKPLNSRVHHHSLRHWRITHLVVDYGFDSFDLSTYAGWTFQTTMSAMGMGSGQLDTYLHLGWQSYFPKLLKPLKVVSCGHD